MGGVMKVESIGFKQYNKGFSDASEAFGGALRFFIKQNGWINPDELLPDPDDMVLLYCPEECALNQLVIAAYDQDYKVFIDNNDHQYWPTYWLRIPDLPKTEEE
jgi:hypothetical protein